MGVTVQFYLLAIPLYRLFKKLGLWAYPVTIVFTIACKAAVYAFVLPALQRTDLSFFAGRQIFTALDNFTAGMAAAWVVSQQQSNVSSKWKNGIQVAAEIGLLYIVCRLGIRFGIHTTNLSGYVWHSAVAFVAFLICVTMSQVKASSNGRLSKLVFAIVACEYEIYLWHLLIINNLLAKSTLIQELVGGNHRIAAWVIMLGLSIVWGMWIKEIVEGWFKEIQNK